MMTHNYEPFRYWVFDSLPSALSRGGVDLTFKGVEFPPKSWPEWIVYDSPSEQKRASEDLKKMPKPLAAIIAGLQSRVFVDWLIQLTGIAELTTDPTLRGGGIHATDPGGMLDVHLDYDIHPTLFMQRRLNLILFLNDKWRPEWGGALKFYRNEGKVEAASILPSFGRMVIFECGHNSYHGCPEPLACPPDVCRQTVAVYYLTPPPGRRRALFVPRRKS